MRKMTKNREKRQKNVKKMKKIKKVGVKKHLQTKRNERHLGVGQVDEKLLLNIW